MIVKGDLNLDQKIRLLKDLGYLIVTKHEKGFKQSLMMDANDDWLEQISKIFQNFIENLQFEDPLHQRFGQDGVIPVTSRGPTRQDCIMLDSTILPSTRRLTPWDYTKVSTWIM